MDITLLMRARILLYVYTQYINVLIICMYYITIWWLQCYRRIKCLNESLRGITNLVLLCVNAHLFCQIYLPLLPSSFLYMLYFCKSFQETGYP